MPVKTVQFIQNGENHERTETILRKRTTDRGFGLIEFTDRYGEECSIQDSSLATEGAIWFGIGDKRMHLTQSMVRQLMPVLKEFAESGEYIMSTETFKTLNEPSSHQSLT